MTKLDPSRLLKFSLNRGAEVVELLLDLVYLLVRLVVCLIYTVLRLRNLDLFVSVLDHLPNNKLFKLIQ